MISKSGLRSTTRGPCPTESGWSGFGQEVDSDPGQFWALCSATFGRSRPHLGYARPTLACIYQTRVDLDQIRVMLNLIWGGFTHMAMFSPTWSVSVDFSMDLDDIRAMRDRCYKRHANIDQSPKSRRFVPNLVLLRPNLCLLWPNSGSCRPVAFYFWTVWQFSLLNDQPLFLSRIGLHRGPIWGRSSIAE